jgi:hypothetical protein
LNNATKKDDKFVLRIFARKVLFKEQKRQHTQRLTKCHKKNSHKISFVSSSIPQRIINNTFSLDFAIIRLIMHTHGMRMSADET